MLNLVGYQIFVGCCGALFGPFFIQRSTFRKRFFANFGRADLFLQICSKRILLLIASTKPREWLEGEVFDQ